MATSIFLAAAEAGSGRSAIALGLLDQLGRRAETVGVYRPLVRSASVDDNPSLDLLLSRVPAPDPLADCIGQTFTDLHAHPDRTMSRIIDRFHLIANRHPVTLIDGAGHSDIGSPADVSVDARMAANLASPMVVVLSGEDRTPAQLRVAAENTVTVIRQHHAQVLAIIANRVDPDLVEATCTALEGLPGVGGTYAVPSHPVLAAPTVRDLLKAGGGTLVHGDNSLLDLEAISLAIGAMTLPNMLSRVAEGSVVLVPGDRADVLLGLLLAHHSWNYPALAGIVLNGGLEVDPRVTTLVDGLRLSLPVVSVPLDTAEAAATFGSVVGRITRSSTRKIHTALALMEEHVDTAAIVDNLDVASSGAVTPLMFEHQLIDRARQLDRHIVLPEGEEDRILLAADQLIRRKVARLTLLGNPDVIATKAQRLQVDIAAAAILDPVNDNLRERFAHELVELRKAKSVTWDLAWDSAQDGSYFGTMMVLDGLADGVVSGSVNTTAHTIRPALQVIRARPGVSVVSSVFFMCLPDKVLVYGDCAINPDPTAEQLADIAISSAATAQQFGVEPRVAMLSYSTGRSGTGADVDKVRAATELVRQRTPDLLVDGPMQYDAAVEPDVAATKTKDSPVAGRASVLIFPDLNTGNNTYKAVQRSAGAVAIGPVLQGLCKPVNDLSRGSLVQDIVNTVAITAIQAADT
ncbi:MAG: phosphate acetyltransferase [Actinomycetales bacterium]|nr:MAG: phosphate acetyltransferase [Actinomycetales bacterium]